MKTTSNIRGYLKKTTATTWTLCVQQIYWSTSGFSIFINYSIKLYFAHKTRAHMCSCECRCVCATFIKCENNFFLEIWDMHCFCRNIWPDATLKSIDVSARIGYFIQQHISIYTLQVYIYKYINLFEKGKNLVET